MLRYVLLLVVFLSACSTGEVNRDYLQSYNGKRLKINPPLSKRYVNQRFVLPNVGKIAPQSVLPPEMQLANQAQKKTKKS